MSCTTKLTPKNIGTKKFHMHKNFDVGKLNSPTSAGIQAQSTNTKWKSVEKVLLELTKSHT